MSNSSLVVCTNISPNKTVGKTHAIDTITPHCVVGQVTAERLGQIFANPEKYASSNYGVDKDGRVGLYVEEKDCSWCSSNRDNDNRAITIEIASDTYYPYAITDAAYEGTIKLMVDICQRNGKKKLTWLGDKAKTLAYTPASDEMRMTVHRWFAQKSCPGDYIYERLPQIAAEVTRRLQGGEVTVASTTTTTTVNYSSYPMLQRGSSGTYVTKLQQQLISLGYSCGSYGADGDFGSATYSAVVAFQRAKGLDADGIVGPLTWAALYGSGSTSSTSTASSSTTASTSTTVSSANEAVKKLLAVAKAEAGYLEKASNSQLDDKTANAGYNNWNKYARDIDEKWPNFYNGKKNGYAWCDCFADWCFLTAFGYENALKLLCAPEKSAGAGCQYSANYYRKKGQFHTSGPQQGDQIFFGSYGSEGHIGIVTGVDDSMVYTIEGNTSSDNGVVSNGGGVFEKAYNLNSSYIAGYGRPDWSLVVGTSSSSSATTPTTTSTSTTTSKTTTTTTTAATTVSYLVRVTSPVTMYSAAGGSVRGQVPKGAYTIVQEQTVNGTTYGKLKSGVGWLDLSKVTKV